MGAPKGNRFWMARAKHGKGKKLTPSVLWKRCCEYFEWVEDNPLTAAETVKFRGKATLTEVPKMRAMTKEGLYIFIEIDRKTWASYKKDDDYLPVITRVEDIIYQQKLTGAAAEMLNPNIIARDLGLSDKAENTVRGSITVTIAAEDADI